MDLKLPPYQIVEVQPSLKTLADRPKTWGIGDMNADKVPSTGQGSIAFILDTEDTSRHPDTINSVVPEYNSYFTDEGGIPGLGHHGLHVADTVWQMAPGSKLAFSKMLTNNGVGAFDWAVQSIGFIKTLELKPEHRNHKKIISGSFGSGFPHPPLRDAIIDGINHGLFFVFAAGNDARDVDYPGNYSESITVGAYDEAGRPASFTSPGETVDVAAPGVRVWAAWENGYAALDGTSMATPHVTAAVAHILEMHPEIENQYQLEAYVKEHATDIHIPGVDPQTGAGKIDLLKYITPPVEPPDKNFPWWLLVILGAIIIAYFIIRGL